LANEVVKVSWSWRHVLFHGKKNMKDDLHFIIDYVDIIVLLNNYLANLGRWINCFDNKSDPIPKFYGESVDDEFHLLTILEVNGKEE